MQRSIVKYTVALAAIAAVTAAFAPFNSNVSPTTVSLTMLLAVLVIATIYGSRPALAASVVGVFCFNYFFLPPIYTLTIADPQNWVALTAFLVTSVIAGQLSAYAKQRAEESELRRQKIEGLYTELQNAFDEASKTEAMRQSEKLKSALLDAVTHDLRTPLTSIKAAVTTLMEEGKTDDSMIVLDNEARLEFLEIINEESDRLNEFIGGMVDLARIQAGDMILRKTWISSDEIIRRALDRTKHRLNSRSVVVKIERELPIIHADAVSVTEALHLLLDNAGKYSPPDSEISVAAKRSEGETIEFSVEDKGKGISQERRNSVFDKFYRSDDDDIHTTGSGLGLGLSITRGIVESQGGNIWIEDGRDGFTTRIVFRIPIGDEERNGDLNSQPGELTNEINN